MKNYSKREEDEIVKIFSDLLEDVIVRKKYFNQAIFSPLGTRIARELIEHRSAIGEKYAEEITRAILAGSIHTITRIVRHDYTLKYPKWALDVGKNFLVWLKDNNLFQPICLTDKYQQPFLKVNKIIKSTIETSRKDLYFEKTKSSQHEIVYSRMIGESKVFTHFEKGPKRYFLSLVFSFEKPAIRFDVGVFFDQVQSKFDYSNEVDLAEVVHSMMAISDEVLPIIVGKLQKFF